MDQEQTALLAQKQSPHFAFSDCWKSVPLDVLVCPFCLLMEAECHCSPHQEQMPAAWSPSSGHPLHQAAVGPSVAPGEGHWAGMCHPMWCQHAWCCVGHSVVRKPQTLVVTPVSTELAGLHLYIPSVPLYPPDERWAALNGNRVSPTQDSVLTAALATCPTVSDLSRWRLPCSAHARSDWGPSKPWDNVVNSWVPSAGTFSINLSKALSGVWSSPDPEHTATIAFCPLPSRGKILCLLQYPKLSDLISCWK